jgi:enoyl-CoA hydratase/carnithine racemase
MNTQDYVLLETRDSGLSILTINSPARRNALSRAVVDALRAHLRTLSDKPGGVVVLTGAGPKAFCAGADLKERATMAPDEVETFVSSLRAMMDELSRLPQPTIAAIGGYALGGGCELALACDLRVMADGALIGLPETHLGIIPGAGGTQRLPRLIGPARAKELIFTGRRLSADEALDWGIVNRTAPADALMEAVEALAAPMLTAAPIAQAQAKRAIDGGLDGGLAEGLSIERACYAVTIPTEDRLEALAAFRDKRKPVFKGR